MQTSVQGAFRRFNEPLEGVVHHMYLDIKGLVTIGVGNLIDPIKEVMPLPFRFKENTERLATPEEIMAEWKAVKANTGLAKKGHVAASRVTTLEISDEAVGALIQRRLAANEKIIKKQAPFAKWDAWPADAQLGVLSMSWAMGPSGFAGFPRFCAACAALDFRAAAAQCKLADANNAGLAPRNVANRLCFRNAAVVSAKGLDRAVLHYPADAAPPITRSAALAMRSPPAVRKRGG